MNKTIIVPIADGFFEKVCPIALVFAAFEQLNHKKPTQILNVIVEDHDLPVYYNPKKNELRAVHEVTDKAVVLSGGVKYYNDVHINQERHALKIDPVEAWGWIPVNKDDFLSHNFLVESRFGLRVNPEFEKPVKKSRIQRHRHPRVGRWRY